MENKQKIEEDIDWEEFDRMLRMEMEWRESLPRFTNRYLLETFPEAKEIIPQKIEEWQEERDKLSKKIKEKLILIKYGDLDGPTKQFQKDWIEMTDGVSLLKVDAHIRRLKCLALLAKNKKPKGHLTEKQIQMALSVPIQDVLGQKFMKFGNKMIGLCPFHNEKSPSFYIYLQNNSFYCFGCQVGGDIIALIRQLHKFSFVEAVSFLIHI